MQIGNYDVSLKGIVNLDTQKKRQGEIVKRIAQTQLTRSTADIRKWRTALSSAEGTERPTRVDLIRIYKEVELDNHLASLVTTRKNKVLSRGFNLIDKDGAVNVEATDLFKTQWFHTFANMALDSVFYGYSLIEFGRVINDEYTSITSIPRQYVIPEKQVFTLTIGGQEVPFNMPPISDWSIFVHEPGEMGLFNKATPIVLWKRLVMAVWAEFNELYGVPIRIGRTASNDPEIRGQMEDMLENLGSNAWAVFDPDDQIEVVTGLKVGGQGTFKDFIKLADEQLSKLILGQTMTSDDGASRSQAEVHENILASYTGKDITWLGYVINNKLLPQMVRHGFKLEGLKFVWDLEEKLSKEEQFKIDQVLLQSYDIPEDYITAMYGTPVERKKEIQPEALNSIMPAVRNLYNDFLTK